MLTNKTKYGLKALIYIYKNKHKTPIPIAEIAKSENISHKFLEAILLTLRKNKILASKKGKNGGYYLLKNPKEVYMSDVLRMLDGPIAMVPCVSLNYYERCEDCPDEATCGVNRLMLDVRDSVLDVLTNKSLVDLAEESK